MEIKHIFKKMERYKKLLGISFVAGIFIGVAAYFFPSKYIATGSLFINRSVNKETAYFTYEGYYGQQTAAAYTNSVLALMDSLDIKKIILETNQIPLTSANIKALNKLISIKKPGPQVISVTIKGRTYDEAQRLWISMANATVGVTSELNKKGDPNLSVSLVSTQPLVRLPYKSIYLFIAGGVLTSLLAACFAICIKEYSKS